MAKRGQWEWHSGELTLTCSDEVERLLLVRNGSKFHPGEVVFRNIHAEDCAETSKLLQPGLAHGANFQTNYRVVLEHGQIAYLHQEAMSETTEDGSHVLTGTVQDITALRRTEEQAHLLTYYDEVTKLPNRTMINQDWRSVVA